MRLLLFVPAVLLILSSCGTPAASEGAAPDLFDAHRGVRLQRFASARAFDRYVAQIRRLSPMALYDMAPSAEPPPIDPGAAGPAMAAQARVEPEPLNPTITNNQTAGVDEGGIVKQIGRFLVVLEDGRLFSADLGAGAGAPLTLADRVDVYRSPESAASWYDEMLVHGNRILVAGYDYREGATEISVFVIDDRGRFEREGRFLLSSNDYYSTENYSTRLVGDSLVFYAPVELSAFDGHERFRMPRLRRAGPDGAPDEGDALIRPTDVYAPPGRIERPVLHALSVCPLRRAELECRTTAFIGGASREIHVTPTDAFLWVGAPDGMPWDIEYANRRRRACRDDEFTVDLREQAAMLYRVPLSGAAIGAVAVDGYPADQFALESSDGRLRALLGRPLGDCDRSDRPFALFLLDVPLGAFGRDVRRVSERGYTPLPSAGPVELENRFVGNWLIYGGAPTNPADTRNGSAVGRLLFAVPLDRPAQPVRLALPHDAIRIERAGSDAVVTGYGREAGLSISYVALAGAPRVAATTTLAGRYESEGRSHAFGAAMSGDGTGLLGLPTVRRAERAGRGWSESERSDLSYIAVESGHRLRHAGELGAGRREPAPGYRCEVSCVDWYGNSRPIFTGGRIFALMGTELVEGRLEAGRIAPIGRLDLTGQPLFARVPPAPAPAR
jgi:hypothetical protein